MKKNWEDRTIRINIIYIQLTEKAYNILQTKEKEEEVEDEGLKTKMANVPI